MPLVTLGVQIVTSAFEPLKNRVLLLKKLVVLWILTVADLVLVLSIVNPLGNVIDLGRKIALPLLLEVLLIPLVAIPVLATRTVNLFKNVSVHGRHLAKLKVLVFSVVSVHLPPSSVWRVLVTPYARQLTSVKDYGKNLVKTFPLSLCLALTWTIKAVLVLQATPSATPSVCVFVLGRHHVSQWPQILLACPPLVILGALIIKNVSDHGKPLV